MIRKRGRRGKDTANVAEAVRRINVNGFEEFQKTLREVYATGNLQVHVLFCGEKNPQGVSWCPDCVRAEPFIEKAINDYARKDSVFIEVNVGDRDTYKDRENPFRLDKETQIKEIPTLMRWKTVLRLEGDQCAKPYLLEMLFNEPDEEESK